MNRYRIVGPFAASALLAGCAVPGDQPTPVQPAKTKAPAGHNAGGPSRGVKTTPIKLAARRAAFRPSVLASGGSFSCVKVTVTNKTRKNLDVNPMYFSLVDAKGVKHEASDALGMYEGQMSTTTLAPDEAAKGTVCTKGKFTPKIVAMTNALFSEAARAQVSDE